MCLLAAYITPNPASPKHLYNICTMLVQHRRHWADIVQILQKCFALAGKWLQQTLQRAPTIHSPDIGPRSSQCPALAGQRSSLAVSPCEPVICHCQVYCQPSNLVTPLYCQCWHFPNHIVVQRQKNICHIPCGFISHDHIPIWFLYFWASVDYM